TQFNAFSANFAGGVRVAVADFNNVGTNDIAAATGPGDGLERLFDARTSGLMDHVQPFGGGFTSGVFVGSRATTDPSIQPFLGLPVVTIAATTPDVPESSSATSQFTLSRTGDTKAGLKVSVSTGGTATATDDYSGATT